MDDFINLKLRFSKARLFICNYLLEEQGDCSSALIEGAICFGILPETAMSRDDIKTEGKNCHAMHAAESILHKYLEIHNIKAKDKHIHDFRRNVRLFKILDSKGSQKRIECLRLTPAIFDILLQQIQCIK